MSQSESLESSISDSDLLSAGTQGARVIIRISSLLKYMYGCI